MNFQVMGRYQRARGFKLKQSLQYATLIAICIWLLYQISRPHDKNSSSKFTDQHSILWRKVNIGLLVRTNESNLEGRKTINKSKTWEGDDKLAISHKEKIDDHPNEISSLADDKNDRENSKVEQNDLRADDAKGYQDSMLNFMHSSQGNLHIEAEIHGKKNIHGKKVTMVINKESKHHLALALEDKDALLPDRMDNRAEIGLHESGFDDENGVPFGMNDVAEPKVMESSDA